MVEPETGERHVVAALLRRSGRVLLCHRAAQRRWYPDVWDLPGGHVEDREDPRQALERELREELGVELTALGEPFARVQGANFRMDIWLIDVWVGEPSNRAPIEHDALAWVDLVDARELRLADPGLLDLLRRVLRPGGGRT